MKLLLDQNLPPRLASDLSDLFPDTTHVSAVGLDRASDSEVRHYALNGGFVIVTKDADFGELSLVLGFPPCIVWIRRGNCTTRAVEAILRESAAAIQELGGQTEIGVLELL